jgi:phosphoglycerate-specific signal transduction histidine kinase
VQELIIFKKDTDAVGTNRGFVYQYLSTLIQWLNNYESGEDNLIYCEVEDDIKQINRERTAIKWTQIKCYSSVFNLGHRDIIKSLHNFFVLFISFSEFDGSFCFETNSKISSNDKLLERWLESQTSLESDVALLTELVVKIQNTLSNSATKTKDNLMKVIANKISTLENKKSSAAKKKNRQLINELKEEHSSIEELFNEMQNKISDIETVSEFIHKIKWKFDDIKANESVEKLKDQALQLLKEICPKNTAIDLYFNRLISEIFFKTIEIDIEDRCLDNDLLDEILSETKNQINENVDRKFLDRFNSVEELLKTEFDDVHKKLDKLVSNISEAANIKPDVPLINLPTVELEEVRRMLNADSVRQSKLEMKIKMINIHDIEQQNHLIDIATELRCRYLLFLQKLKFENLHSQYEALKSLEGKVERHCTDTVINNDVEAQELFNPRAFWNAFQAELKLLLKELIIRNKVDIDEDVVFAQMYQMAAECHLRWHIRGEI